MEWPEPRYQELLGIADAGWYTVSIETAASFRPASQGPRPLRRVLLSPGIWETISRPGTTLYRWTFVLSREVQRPPLPRPESVCASGLTFAS